MQQQLLEGTVNIVPDTMNHIIIQLTSVLSSSTLDDGTLENMIKALFYGLWNFDKMINQHNLSTAISLMPLSIPKQVRKNGIKFYQKIFTYLTQKWNLIDKHRINKFMQLVRYLMRESFNFCKNYKIKRSRADEVLKNTVFADLSSRNGILYHVTDLYFEIVANYCIDNNEQFDFTKLELFEWLLKNHQIQHFRHHVIDKIYGKYKEFLIQSFTENQTQLESELQKVINHFLQTAKLQQKDLQRKNIYLLVGYLKSEQMNFFIYEQEKQQKALLQKQKIKKKLSTHKVKLIKQQKQKRKQKNKQNNKNKKIISKRKFETNKIRGNKKYIEEF